MPAAATPPAAPFAQHYDQLAAHFASASAARDVGVVLMRIGRVVLMRQLIAHQLRSDSRQDSSSLVTCLHAVNTSLLATLTAHVSGAFEGGRGRRAAQPCADVPEGLLCDAAPFLEAVGQADPVSTVYEVTDGAPATAGNARVFSDTFPSIAAGTASAAAASTKVPATMALPLFVLPLCTTLLLNVEHTAYNAQFDSCIPAEKKDNVDATVLAVGVASLLQQFPLEATQLVVQLMAQVMRVSGTMSSNRDTSSKASAGGQCPLIQRCAGALPIWMDVLRGYIERYSEQEWAHTVGLGSLDQYMQSPHTTPVAGVRAQ